VRVPFDYPEVFMPDGRRKIRVKFGSEIARPLNNETVYVESDMGAPVLEKTISRKLAIDLNNSVTSKGKTGWMIYLLIAAVIAGGYLFYNQYQKNQAAKENPPSPVAAQPAVPSDGGIEQAIINDGGKVE
jgi:hypothetical protein